MDLCFFNGVSNEVKCKKFHPEFELCSSGSNNLRSNRYATHTTMLMTYFLNSSIHFASFTDDRSAPNVDRNEELILLEGGSAVITTKFLSASDANVNSSLLKYTVTKQPKFGHLVFTSASGEFILSIL